jgi:multiple sugar transport system ATP-binding protein
VSFIEVSRTHPGNSTPSVAALDLEIVDGELLTLVGPSGCGKTTSLRMVAGLEPVDSGRIEIGDRDVTRVRPQERDVALVFQSYAIYPHMSVAENIGFPLKMQGLPKREIADRVRRAAEMLELGDYLERKPKALSGGERQRVAMGRAVVREPKVFLMDEPLSNLDAKLRVQTRTQILELQRRLGVTTIYVTHDQAEALMLGDRVAVMNKGRLQQVGKPQELYERPANVFVASFIGSPAMNLFESPVADGAVRLAGRTLRVPPHAGPRVVLGVRPEDVRLAGENGHAFRVELIEFVGTDAYLHGELDGVGRLVARVDPREAPAEGSTVRVELEHDRMHVFAHDSGDRLESSPTPPGS